MSEFGGELWRTVNRKRKWAASANLYDNSNAVDRIGTQTVTFNSLTDTRIHHRQFI